MARHFDNWLKAYLEYTKDTEAPTAFHWWTGVSTIGGALRRRVWINMRKYQYTANFYIVLVGPAGVVTKSTTIGVGEYLLSHVDKVHFGPQSFTWQALGKDFEKASDYVEYTKRDGSVDRMPQAALTVSASELGTFLTMDDQKFVSFITDMWDGKEAAFRHHTATSIQLDVKNPWLNIIGCTTPSWLQQNFPKEAIGGGLASRVIFIYAEKKQKLIAYPDEQINSEEYYKHQAKLIEDLQEIGAMAGEFVLSPDARAWGKEWYLKFNNSPRPAYMASDRYSGYLGRKFTHMHKLAIVLSAARSSKLVIEKETLMEAETVLNITEKHMIKVFHTIGMVEEAQHVQEVVEFVRGYGQIEREDLWQQSRNIMQQRDFIQAVKIAVEGGLLSCNIEGGKAIYRAKDRREMN